MNEGIWNDVCRIGAILQTLTAYEVIHHWVAGLPYQWGLASRQKLGLYLGTIQLSAGDIVSLHRKSDDESAAYLSQRFAHLL